MQRAGSGGRGRCEVPQIFPRGLKWSSGSRLLSSCVTASVLSARPAYSELQNAVSLCSLTTRAEHLASSSFLAGYGATVSGFVFIVHVTAAMLMGGRGVSVGGRAEAGKCRRRNVLICPLSVSM